MATYRNTTDDRVDIPLLDLHIGPGETFEVPDELAASLDHNPVFATSRAKHPDQTPDPVLSDAAVTAIATAPIAVLPPAVSIPDGPDTDPAAA